MKIYELLNKKYGKELGEFTNSSVWLLHQAEVLKVFKKDRIIFKNKSELREYELEIGDTLVLGDYLTTYKTNNKLTINSIKSINGVSESILDKIEKHIGYCFSYEELKSKSSLIKGLGNNTLENIKKGGI